MFRTLSNLLLITAVLAATGTHWAVLQSVAWSGMLASNLKTGSVLQAVERTFDGNHPCALCKQISRGKQTEKKPEFQPDWKRLEFAYTSEVILFTAPEFFWETDSLALTRSHFNESPPVPPPKAFHG